MSPNFVLLMQLPADACWEAVGDGLRTWETQKKSQFSRLIWPSAVWMENFSLFHCHFTFLVHKIF